LSRTQADLFKSFERLHRPRHGRILFADIHLGYLLAFTFAGVGEIELNLNVPSRLVIALWPVYGQIAISKGRVRQSVAEREKRFRPAAVEAAIAKEQAFAIHHAARAGFRIVGVMDRVIIPAAFKRYRQPSGRIYVSK